MFLTGAATAPNAIFKNCSNPASGHAGMSILPTGLTSFLIVVTAPGVPTFTGRSSSDIPGFIDALVKGRYVVGA